MEHGRAPIRRLAPVMLVTSTAFLLLAAITGFYGTDYGLDGETANILAFVFLFVAVADAFASVLLKHRSGPPPVVSVDRTSMNLCRQLGAPASDRQDLDRAEDEGMIAR
jgi:hypothetical protein